jgi:hypothetical protein
MSLTKEQLKALAMFSEGLTSNEIATRLKVSIRTIQRWQKLPEFIKAVTDIHQKATQTTVETTASNISNRIQSLLPKALNCIESLLDDPDARAADKLRACNLVGSWAGLTQQKLVNQSPQTEQPQSSAGLSDELVEQIRRQVLGVN